MKQISSWARQHKWMARIAIVFIYLLLNAIGFFLGDVLSQAGIFIPGYVPYLLTIPFLAFFVYYPHLREKAKYKHFYRSRKMADVALAGISFLLIICMSNRFSVQEGWQPMTAYAASIVSPSPSTSEINHIKLPIEPKKKKNDFSIKQLRKNLRENIKMLRKEYKAAADAGKVGLIALSVIVAIVLVFLLGYLSCSIACAGSEGLAWTVFLLGTGLIVFLLVRLIRRINQGPARTTTKATTS